MLLLEHLQIDALFLVLIATATSIVGLRVMAVLAQRHVARACELALTRAHEIRALEKASQQAQNVLSS